MKKIYTILFLFNIVFCQTFDYTQIEFTISCLKDVYLVDEPIYIESQVKNTGVNDVSCGFFALGFTDTYEYSFSSSNGDQIKYNNYINVTRDLVLPIATLKPGESIYRVEELLEYFGQIPTNGYMRPAMLPPGTYQLSFTFYTNTNYYFDYLENGTINKHPVTSNTIKFTVVEMSDKQKEEWELCKSAFRTSLKNPEEWALRFNSYFDKYPNSKYDFQILLLGTGLLAHNMMPLANPEFDTKNISLSIPQIMNKMQNHYAVQQYLSGVTTDQNFDIEMKEKSKNIDDYNGMIEAYNYKTEFVKKKYPDSILEKYIKAKEVEIRSNYKYKQEKIERQNRVINIQKNRK